FQAEDGIRDFHVTGVQTCALPISQVYFDTLSYQSPIQTVFYARTDEKGNYKFTHLDPTGNYSVIAIKPGFEFGPSQGTASIKKRSEERRVGNECRSRLSLRAYNRT